MRFALATLCSLLLATPASAQLGTLLVTAGMPDSSDWGKSTRPPEFRTCGGRSSRVGVWKGTGGVVAFTIDSAGDVDTMSVMVARAGNTAEESLESYARRLVAGCTWKPAQVAGRRSTVVVRLNILSERQRSSFIDGPPLPPPTDPGLYLISSRGLDELPRAVECEFHGRKGRVDFSFIVGADGRVEPGSVLISETNSEGTAKAYMKSMPKCVFQPGRIGGKPVRTQLSATIDLVPRDLISVDRVETRTTTKGPP